MKHRYKISNRKLCLYFVFIVFALFIFSSTIIQSLGFLLSFNKNLQIEKLISANDKDNDGLDDYSDIVASAKEQIGKVTIYDTSYYSSAYPPEDRGACTDVVWRALSGAGYDFKQMIDEDILKNKILYLAEKEADPNIDFRRVVNIQTYLKLHAESLTLDVKPYDAENLKNWQQGDLVIFDKLPITGLLHIAIVSDKRDIRGVPYLIDNHGKGVHENNILLTWPTKIIGHYRL